MSRCAVWDFRANENYYTEETIISWMKQNTKKYSFQLEKADDGYIHWQGRFSLIKKRDKNKLLDLFEAFQLQKPNYLKPTVEENHKEEFFYATKADTRIKGPFRDTDKQKEEVYIPKQFRDIKLYPWQQQIIDSAKIFNDREINLIYDPIGNNGKSTVASICEILHNGIDMPPLNDYKELIQLACNICQDTNNRSPGIFLFDMPRAIDQTRLYGLYSAIEQIKKGKLYDTRHHFKKYWIDSPVIWVFTNQLPNTNLLSADRWKIWQIKNNKLKLYEDIIKEQVDKHKSTTTQEDLDI